MSHKLIAISALLFATGCMQQPAQVVVKTDTDYTQKLQNRLNNFKNSESVVSYNPNVSTRVSDNITMSDIKTEEEFNKQFTSFDSNPNSLNAPAIKMQDLSVKPFEPPVQSVQKSPVTFGQYKPESLPETPAINAYDLEKSQSEQWAKAQNSNPVDVKSGFVWPVRGKIISTFGDKQNGAFNDGINIAAPEGKDIQAVADGEVVYAGNELPSYGNMLIVKHNNGWMSAYAHAQRLEVGLGTHVTQGQTIAHVGASGDVQSAQLHFGLRKDKQAVNPMEFLTESLAAN